MLQTTALGGDDVIAPAVPWVPPPRGNCAGAPTVRNGPNGICETTAAAGDEQSSVEQGSGMNRTGSCSDGVDSDGDGELDGDELWCFEPDPLLASNEWMHLVLSPIAQASGGAGQPFDDSEMTAEAFQRSIELLNAADLEIALSADTVEVGEDAVLHVGVVTLGPNPTAASSVSATISEAATFLDAEACEETSAGGELLCELGEVQLEITSDLLLSARTGACEAGLPVPIDASVAVENLAGPDANPANDVATLRIVPVDTTAPAIAFDAPAAIEPRDAPMVFTATATDLCDDEVVPAIVGFDCFAFTKKGRRIDKTASCVVSLDGDSIRIEDTGGVGTTIAWTAEASDASGNVGQATFHLEVILPEGSKPATRPGRRR